MNKKLGKREKERERKRANEREKEKKCVHIMGNGMRY
jgi:hypothetical protein